MQKDYSRKPVSSMPRGLKLALIAIMVIIGTFCLVSVVKAVRAQIWASDCKQMKYMEDNYPLYESNARDIEFCQGLNINIK